MPENIHSPSIKLSWSHYSVASYRRFPLRIFNLFSICISLVLTLFYKLNTLRLVSLQHIFLSLGTVT